MLVADRLDREDRVDSGDISWISPGSERDSRLGELLSRERSLVSSRSMYSSSSSSMYSVLCRCLSLSSAMESWSDKSCRNRSLS